jgi:hypothetical protein
MVAYLDPCRQVAEQQNRPVVVPVHDPDEPEEG